MKKDLLSEDRAIEMIDWWHRIDRLNLDDRKLWLAVYHQHDLSNLQAETRAHLDLIAQINRQTMPKK